MTESCSNADAMAPEQKLPLLPSGSAGAPGIPVVIDTQVVMDWLVFKNPSVAPLTERLFDGHLRWIGSPQMQGELLHVIGRGVANKYLPDIDQIKLAFDRWCTVLAAPAPAVRLVCRDKDDQMFVDLALGAGARWLVSRDRDLLALAKRAKKATGLLILTPENWIKQELPALTPKVAPSPP